MISSLIGDALLSGPKITDGRRFAKSPSAPLIPRSPASGRLLPGCESHLGPPTAPRSTLSDALHFATVSSGSGTPVASIAQPPRSASSYVTPKPNFSAAQSRTFTA